MSVRIMVVDDEPAIGRLLTYQLQGFGYSVSYVQDGLQALEQVLLEDPHLILLDVMMPLVSGWDVCRQIRGSSDVPIIMLTGKNADSDVVTGLQAGADDYITKPFSVAQLQARIEAVLRRSERAGRAGARRMQEPRAQSFARPAAQPVAQPVAQPSVVLAEPERRAVPAELRERVLAQAAGTQAPPQPRRLGQRMREARQRRGLTLYQAERGCQIRWEFLQAIEQENWTYLPRHQLRAAVQAYTGYLGLDMAEAAVQLPAAGPALRVPFAAVAALVVLLLVVGLTLL